MIKVLNCLDGLDAEVIHNNVFSTIPKAAIAEILLHFKRCAFKKLSLIVFRKVHILR